MEDYRSEISDSSVKITIVVETNVNDYSWFAVTKGAITVVFTKAEESTSHALHDLIG